MGTHTPACSYYFFSSIVPGISGLPFSKLSPREGYSSKGFTPRDTRVHGSSLIDLSILPPVVLPRTTHYAEFNLYKVKLCITYIVPASRNPTRSFKVLEIHIERL